MKKLLFAFASALLILGSVGSVMADSTTTAAGSCTFKNERKMVSSFDSSNLAATVSSMEPGDEATFTVDIKNESNISTRWYMSNDVLSSLEDAQAVAENGGYTYILTYTDNDGAVSTIYSSSSIGGEKSTAAGAGLNEATDSLDEFFYLDTLETNEVGKVSLLVALDGESQGNIYQDTLAKLMMNFAVEEDNGTTITTTTPKVYTSTTRVKTGDIWSIASGVLLAVGVVLLFAAFFGKRREASKNEKIS